MKESEESISTISRREKVANAVAVTLFVMGSIGLMDLLIKDLERQEKELDLLCGEDRISCVADRDVECDSTGSFPACIVIDRYATFTPEPTPETNIYQSRE